MKKLIVITMLLVFSATAVLAADVRMVKDADYLPVQVFAARADRRQPVATITTGATQAYTVTGWAAARFRCSGDVVTYFGAETTKTMTYNGSEVNTIGIRNGDTSFVLKNAGASSITCEMWGM